MKIDDQRNRPKEFLSASPLTNTIQTDSVGNIPRGSDFLPGDFRGFGPTKNELAKIRSGDEVKDGSRDDRRENYLIACTF